MSITLQAIAERCVSDPEGQSWSAFAEWQFYRDPSLRARLDSDPRLHKGWPSAVSPAARVVLEDDNGHGFQWATLAELSPGLEADSLTMAALRAAMRAIDEGGEGVRVLFWRS